MTERIDWHEDQEPIQVIVGFGGHNGATEFYFHPDSNMISGYFDPEDGPLLVAFLRDIADSVEQRIKEATH